MCFFPKKQKRFRKFLSFFSDLSLEDFCSDFSEKVQKNGDRVFEIEARQLAILSKSKDYPIAKKSHGVDFLLKHRHLWLRSKRQRAILSIRSEIVKNIHHFFSKRGFYSFGCSHPPAQTASEGNFLLVSLLIFFEEDQVFLSQSGQLHMEAGCCRLWKKFYCFWPYFSG